MSPGTKPISFSSRADSCDNALRVIRESFHLINLSNTLMINFKIILLDVVNVVVWDMSKNAMDRTSLCECNAA